MTLLHDGRYYDALHTFMVRDVAYWQRIAGPQPCRVLELGCGTGRVAIPLARDGHDVTGIDVSESMLERARGKAEQLPVRFIRADMRDFAVGTFDRIIVPFNGLRLLLEREDLERCLACVRRALAPDGRFAVDITMPRPEQLVAEQPTTTHQHVDPETRGPIIATHVRRYDRLQQIVTLDATFRLADGTTVTDNVVQRIYFPEELRALFHYNGLEVVEHHGDYDGAPLTAESPQLLLVARDRGA